MNAWAWLRRIRPQRHETEKPFHQGMTLAPGESTWVPVDFEAVFRAVPGLRERVEKGAKVRCEARPDVEVHPGRYRLSVDIFVDDTLVATVGMEYS